MIKKEMKLQNIYLTYCNLLIGSTFIATSSSNPVSDLSDGIHRIKFKFRYDDQKCETCRIKYRYCDCFLECTNFKGDLIKHKWLICNKNCQIKFDEKLK